jgi:clan AA aspartic protease (TIGR02281 family)
MALPSGPDVHFRLTGVPKTMICPKCHSALDLPANACPQCGAALQRSGGRFLIFTAAIVLAVVLGVYGYIQYTFSGRHDGPGQTTSRPSEDSPYGQPSSDVPRSSAASEPSVAAAAQVLTGELILKDVAGGTLGAYPVALASSGWFAFPTHFLIGARSWQVMLDDGRSFAVEGAILQDGDPVGLWAAETSVPLEGPALAHWAPQQPLGWHAMAETGIARIVPMSSYDSLGNFDRLPLTKENTVPGFFIQGGRVVGWSFGDLAPGGYLWTGGPGAALIPEFYTDDFYRLTFEGSREEAFFLAMADPSLSDLQRLTALAEAHLLETRMPRDMVPDRIAPAEIHQEMRRLVDELRRQNRTADLWALFDSQILSAVNHGPLIADLAAAAREVGDYAEAQELLEIPALSASEDDQSIGAVEELQRAVYRDWLDRLLLERDVEGARSLYGEAIDRFPQDPAIQLTGIELLLLAGNWALAERRLDGRSYPPELRDRVIRLEREIADAKSREGKILIRFRPGSRTVPVTATVGDAVRQPFLIDTGATVVTVPSDTVRRLGIDLSDTLPRRLFYSATGAQNAVEVTLPSIDIDGWSVADVKALVVDLPGQPGIGLLGMNYLRNFRLDLDTDEGLLTLAPR